MRIFKPTFFILIIFSLSQIVFSQTATVDTTSAVQPADAEAAKKKKEQDEKVVQMLEQAVVDGNSLRLSQNKAIVFAMSGDLYWKFDEKRARTLFRDAANELISFNAELEREQREAAAGRNMGPPEINDTRIQVLNIVANRDAEMAYQMLLQTRPAKLAEAMAKAGQPAVRGGGVAGGPGGRPGFDLDSVQAMQETQMEQQFALRAAQNDPDALAKLIKESMAKGVSTNVLQMLQNLNRKDEKRAGEIANDVVRNLVDADLTKNVQDINTAMSFLQFATQPRAVNLNEKQFNFNDSQTRDIASKIVATLTSAPASPQLTQTINRALPLIQKVMPEKAMALNQKLAEIQKTTPATAANGPNRGPQQPRVTFDRNATPEDILAQIPKMTTDAEKRMAYQTIANRVGSITDDARAQKLIDQIPDDAMRAQAQQQFDSAKINRSTNSGKLDDARLAIGALTDKKSQIQKMVALALQYQKNGGEKDLESARSLMREAKGMVKENPDDEDDLADLMEVVRGYAVVEPETAFRLAEPIMDEFNQMVQATATLSKYNKRDRSFKKGEMILRANGGGGGLLMFRYIPQIQLLGKADLNRMSQLADHFGRSDARTIVRLYVLQGFLRDDSKRQTATGTPPPAPAPVPLEDL